MKVIFIKWQTTLYPSIDEFFTQGKLLIEITLRNKRLFSTKNFHSWTLFCYLYCFGI